MSAPPNILFLFSDQHNPRFLGHAGHPFVRTPHLDRLAAEGTRFSSAYTPNPICVPARYDMLAGRYSRDTLVYHNNQVPPEDLPSFAGLLSEAGWRSALIGKAHFTGADQYRGYDERPYGDLRGIGHQADPYRGAHPALEGINGVGHHPAGGTFKLAGPSGIPEGQMAGRIITHEAVKWLQVHRAVRPGMPFLLSVHYPKPHFPLCPPARWFHAYRDATRGHARVWTEEELADRPPVHRRAWETYLGYGASQEDLDRALAAYAGCVSFVDECIGQILESLEHLGFAENTLVVYAADHGELAGAHGLWHKQLFYEESVRVPLIFRGPGVPHGAVREEPVSLVDLLPTFCALADLPVPDGSAGVDLGPALRGERADPDRTIFSEIGWRPDWQGCMVRWRDWKYCWYLDGAAELYNLAADPDEDTNLAGADAVREVERGLHERLAAFWEPDRQAERRDRLPALKENKGAHVAMQYVLPDGTWVDAWP